MTVLILFTHYLQQLQVYVCVKYSSSLISLLIINYLGGPPPPPKKKKKKKKKKENLHFFKFYTSCCTAITKNTKQEHSAFLHIVHDIYNRSYFPENFKKKFTALLNF